MPSAAVYRLDAQLISMPPSATLARLLLLLRITPATLKRRAEFGAATILLHHAIECSQRPRRILTICLIDADRPAAADWRDFAFTAWKILQRRRY